MNFAAFCKENRDCSICSELTGRHDHRLSKVLDACAIDSSVMVRSHDFAAIPSLGPLVTGHSLIVTRSHESSVILYTGRKHLWQELEQILNDVKSIFEKNFGCSDFIAFEHGSVNDAAMLCSTNHAHLHVVPLRPHDLPRIADRLNLEEGGIHLRDLPDICTTARDFIVYCLFTRDDPTRLWKVIQADTHPSQYMRRELASAFGLDGWDWKLNPVSSVFRETIELYVSEQ